MAWFRKQKESAEEAPAPKEKGNLDLVVLRPERFSDATKIADRLLSGKSVVMNLEALDPDNMKRLLDFVSGVAYALDGSIKRIAGDATYIVTPERVSVSDGDASEEG